jgi:hypothetical protein
MNNVLFIRPYLGNANGLCNQLSFLINGILYASKNGIQNVIVDNFLKDNVSLSSCPFSDIINIPEFNNFLTRYNVSLKDKNFLDISVNTKIMEKQFTNCIQYGKTSVDDSWIDHSQFYFIYNNIPFHSNYYNLANNLISEITQKLGDDIKINVIHLRIEDDALNHWSKMNNMNPFLYKKILVRKYLYFISKYINKYAFTILLSYNKKNIITNFLNKNGYYYFTKKSDFSSGRECNALIDLLLARKMNNFFIGAAGSTFSHFINNSVNFKKSILIDIININNPVSITEK